MSGRRVSPPRGEQNAQPLLSRLAPLISAYNMKAHSFRVEWAFLVKLNGRADESRYIIEHKY